MTTTLRPTEPLQHEADGARSRRYQVCVNSRPVGAVHLATDPAYGDPVARILDLRIDEPDRRRGRGTVAALAAEEVARDWGCRRIEASLPDDAPTALRLATALGYVLRNRRMDKALGATPPELPAGSRGRPMTEAEFVVWEAAGRLSYAESWIERGVPAAEAHAKAKRDHEQLMPQGVASADTTFSVLEHEGTRVGTLWLGRRDGLAFVYKVEADAAHRGRGHGRTLMLLAETQAIEAGRPAISLNVFAGNRPAERLYESLGYETVTHHLYKDLL
ncbi:GNAT family N-acetyltransferase [Streptomyces sp. WI04-05B]|uniref:GNAT family N-acetyltransferase n=1 Tax=Streptomyces TaxID=1883 RepID=UPI0029B3BAA8|nr:MULTISPECIES: GNAT family N-acetyltransferase [unclassified Streptomyces]MDX2540789.1 GNAT family N-acetyltransferase [Streptomyces sp. WI04-05B]MDX2585906.1 GNAT family N-acetyltransferase [Streptomyces sp. WI04-05A]MDX3746060.1 GNAT family N-acetyltransferase [Streptomyces sp. AK08-02]